MQDEFIQFLIDHKRNLNFSVDGTNQVSFTAFKRAYPIRNYVNRIGERGGVMFLSGYELDTVIWTEGLIAQQSWRNGKDVISFDFCGCSMALCLNGNRWMSAHIQMSQTPSIDCRCAWIRFMAELPALNHLIMFQPGYKNTPEHRLKAWGVITKEHHCYSVFAEPLDSTEMVFELVSIYEHGVFFVGERYDQILDGRLLAGDGDTAFKNVSKVWDEFWPNKLWTELIWSNPQKYSVSSVMNLNSGKYHLL